MPKRVSPIETIRADIDTVFATGKPIEECLEELMRHSVRLVLQQVLEDEVTTWLGRDWNARGDRERAGWTLSTKFGSVDNLKCLTRCGCSPNARQIFEIAVWVNPTLAAIDRVDQ